MIFVCNKLKHSLHTMKQLASLKKVLFLVETRLYCQVASKNKRNDWCIYTESQQSLILEALNQCLVTNIPRKYLSAKRLQNIKDYLKPKVVLTDLNQLIDVEGIGLISAHQICDKILNEVKGETKEDKVKISGLVTPTLPHSVKQKLETAVGLNIGFNAISWAQLNCKIHRLLVWNYYDLENALSKKYDLYDLFHIAMDLHDRIPDADVYIIENSNWSNIANSKVSVSLQMQRSQLVTAILTVFNIQKLNSTEEKNLPELTNRVYFLKRRLYARLFHTIVGSECVSAQSIIEQIFEMHPDDRYCPVSVDGILQNYYHSLGGPVRDNLSHSLMLVMAFVNLVVLGRQQSLQALLSHKSKLM